MRTMVTMIIESADLDLINSQRRGHEQEYTREQWTEKLLDSAVEGAEEYAGHVVASMAEVVE